MQTVPRRNASVDASDPMRPSGSRRLDGFGEHFKHRRHAAFEDRRVERFLVGEVVVEARDPDADARTSPASRKGKGLVIRTA